MTGNETIEDLNTIEKAMVENIINDFYLDALQGESHSVEEMHEIKSKIMHRQQILNGIIGKTPYDIKENNLRYVRKLLGKVSS